MCGWGWEVGGAKAFGDYLRLGFSLKTEVIREGLGEEVGAREAWGSWADPGLLQQGLQLLELLPSTKFWDPGAS